LRVRSAYADGVLRRLAVSLSCALWLTAVEARAAPDLPVKLLVGACPDLDEAEIRRIAAAELRAQPSAESGPNVLEIAVTCEGSRVLIRVQDPLSRKGVQRSFNLGLSDPKARSRLVAIAATELVLASWAELELGRPMTVAPEGGVPTDAEKRKAAEIAAALGIKLAPPGQPAAKEAAVPYEPKERHWYDVETPADRMFRFSAVVSARKFFDQPGLLWGGGLRLGEERFRFISWAADILIESGTVGTGERTYQILTSTLGGSLLLWGRVGPITGRIGAGLRAGFAEVGGSASSVAPWGWPLGTSSLSFRTNQGIVLDLVGEGGYVVLPAGSAGQPGLRGGWFSGQIGIGYAPRASHTP
jgi:hypothetical protein